MSITMISMFVIFVGYSSYALLLIRSSANTPMNQNAPDNVFALSSYLNREQYGERPLFYGETFNSSVLYEVDGSGKPKAKKEATTTTQPAESNAATTGNNEGKKRPQRRRYHRRPRRDKGEAPSVAE